MLPPTAAGRHAAAKKYYRPDNLVFLLLGNAAKIREAAQKYAAGITEIAVTAPGFRPFK
jgi:predicted Zn-dependent peptidase